jgi:hypothetical protein
MIVMLVVLGRLGTRGVYASQPSTCRRLDIYASQSQCLHKRGRSGWLSEHPQLSTETTAASIELTLQVQLVYEDAVH